MTIRGICGLVVLVAIAAVAAPVAGQDAHHMGQDPNAHHMSAEIHPLTGLPKPIWMHLSTTALDQIARVEASVTDLATPEAARAAGFVPTLGLIPTMGVHWVNTGRVRDANHLDLDAPDHLMFAPINGKETLIGVAFAYNAGPDDTPPDGFDGDADSWHTHPGLAPPDSTLTMLHVWFVPSPDGAFAGHNPWLPYWVAGIQPPSMEVMHTPEGSRRVRGLALAIAETLDDASISRRAGRIAQRVGDIVEPRRAVIRGLLPDLDAAERAGDRERWNELADRAVAEWTAIRDAYLAAIPLPAVRQRLADFYNDMLTGGHAGEHH